MATIAYDNPGGTGTGGIFVPEVWSKDILLGLQAETFVPEIVKRYDTDVTDAGDKIHVPRIAARTATTRGASSTITFSAVTETEFTLDVTTEAYDAFEVRDLLKVQSKYDLRQAYTQESSKAVARKLDSDVLNFAAAHTLVTLTIGNSATTTTKIAATYLSRAMMNLNQQNVPADQRFLVCDAISGAQILEVDNFVRWDATGKGNGPLITGKLGTYYGLEVMMNNNLATTVAANVGTIVAFHKTALAIALQKNLAVTSQYDINSDSTKVLVKSIYGYGAAFTNAIVKIYYGMAG